jgi:hypothetical protein
MHWILIIIAVIIAIFLAILVLFVFSFSNGGKPPEYKVINELESLLGNNKLLTDYEVIEFKSKIADSQSHLVIKLEDIAFKKIIDSISATKRNSPLTNTNESIYNIWILRSTGFYLNPEFVINNCHKDYRLSVEGDNKKNTITYNSIFIGGSC